MSNTQHKAGSVHIGYTHNPDAPKGPAHSVIKFGNGEPPLLACARMGYAMLHDRVLQEPEPGREICPQCAQFIRADILATAVERFGSGRDFSDAEASGFLRNLVRVARPVVQS